MKLFLYDYTNFGILYVFEDAAIPIERQKWAFSILKSCILDTEFARLKPSDPLYKIFTNNLIINDLYINDRTGGAYIGNPHETNTVFIQKQKQAQLIAPIAIKLVEIIHGRLLFGWQNEIGINIHDTLGLEIINSNPTINQYASGILEYATALKITPEQAYNEIKLEYETFNSIKMRAYTISKKYQGLIRQVTTQEHADALMNEITQKLVLETRI